MMCKAEQWLIENEENLPEMLTYIYDYMRKNDGCLFEEAFESVDSVVYRMWRNK